MFFVEENSDCHNWHISIRGIRHFEFDKNAQLFEKSAENKES